MRKLLLSLALAGLAAPPVCAAPVGLPMEAAVAAPGPATVQLAQYNPERQREIRRRQELRRQERLRRRAIERERFRNHQPIRRGYGPPY